MRFLASCLAVASLLPSAIAGAWEASQLKGEYIESRTCDVYTGPCFANAEVGLTGSEALRAWSIEQGQFDGVDLSGLRVAVATKAESTLSFGGPQVDMGVIRSVVYVDQRADAQQQQALVDFVKRHGGPAVGTVVAVEAKPIDMALDHLEMVGRLQVGRIAELETRKLGKADCVCTNEMIYYPPLAAVDNSEAAYTVEGRFDGRGLGVKWNNRSSRSAFLATFCY
ncbi:MAG: DUF1326 domain-containing protein [Pirellulales bacterium]|nr:DUF1326 domain-containing protein [Pirellulales bacterium]